MMKISKYGTVCGMLYKYVYNNTSIHIFWKCIIHMLQLIPFVSLKHGNLFEKVFEIKGNLYLKYVFMHLYKRLLSVSIH